MLSDIDKPQSGSNSILMPVLALGGLGIAGYFGYQIYDKARADKAIKEAEESALKSTLNRKRTEQRIDTLESKAFVTGINSFGKKVTVNVITQVKEAINQFYIPLTDKNGTTKYIRKSADKIDQAKVKSAFFNTPVSNVAKFAKLYNIYTGKSFINDAQTLNASLYAQIKAIFEVANKKFPSSFK